MTARYRTQPQVHFREFQILERRRSDAGNAIWAQLAGSRIAADALSRLEPSDKTLSEVFPAVEHVRRFNLRNEKALELLTSAEEDLCTMALAYGLSLHEDFAKTCLSMLVDAGLSSRRELKESNMSNVHETIERASGRQVDKDPLALFHFVRFLRNCHIHAGGLVSKPLVAHEQGLSQAQRLAWTTITGEQLPVLKAGDKAVVGIYGLLASLAVCKRLCYEMNLCLQNAIPRETWADMAADEYFSLGKTKPSSPTALRSVRGHIRGRYDALGLSDSELSNAIARY